MSKRKKAIATPGKDALHLWWELSYAQYLTIPRSVMQSMPDKWQSKMASLLNELDETIDWRPKNDTCYYVSLRDQLGFEIGDSLRDYARGRRRIPTIKQQRDQERKKIK